MKNNASRVYRLLFSACLTICLSSIVRSTETTIGTSGAQFLKIGVGSRYLAMGEASVASVSDVYAMYWNPAGLSSIERTSAAFTSVNWIADLKMNYVGLATRVGDQGVLGASFSALTAPEIEITTFEEQNGTGNFYTASSFAIGLSYARQLTARVSLGGSVKYIEERIHLDRASGVGLDFGTLIHTGYESLRIGMSVSNMGSKMNFSGPSLDINYDPQQGQGANGTIPATVKTTGYSLPLAFRLGIAYDILFGERTIMTFTADLKHPNDNIQQGGLGAELAFSERYFLRGGYKINYEEENFGFGGGLQTGLGKQTKLQLDYAWSDFGRLESAQRISVGLTF